MEVYAVYAGWDYEGADHPTPLFDCKSAAEACAARMKEEDGYDWVEVKLQTVHMGSAIAA